MGFRTLEIEQDGPLVRVWLNRPEKRNALNRLALEEIEQAFGELQRQFDARVVVLGGRGASFCSGADRTDPPGSAQAPTSARERRYVSQLGRRACRAIEELDAVTIARVHGHAVGGGAALALACDFRIAAAGTEFFIPEVDLGVPLGWGASARLIQEIGAARAREAILLCDRIEAKQAELWGIVHRAVAPERLDAEVDDWATRLARKPEIAVSMTKSQFRAHTARGVLGDVTETDGDLLFAASSTDFARRSFGTKPGRG